MKLAFVHKADNYFFNPRHMDQTYNNFFIKALPKYAELEVIASNGEVDADRIDADAIILWDASDWGIPRIRNLSSFRGPIVLYANDTHTYTDPKRIEYVKRLGVTHAFAPVCEDYFYEFMPSSIVYFRNYIGIEASYYPETLDYSQRHPEVINSGSKAEGPWYLMRHLVSGVSGVVDAQMEAGFIGPSFPKLLNRFRGGIAACSVFAVQKYFEVPAAGCVSFMEVTRRNHASDLGFTDGVNAVFIDESNYADKIREFIEQPDDSKWERIAENGREFVMKHYTNDAQAMSFVHSMIGVI